MTETVRKTIATYGPARATVRVFTEGHLVRVQWREHGRLKSQSWPNTRDNQINARAFAKGIARTREQRLAGVPRALTMRELWQRYTESEFEHLRANTRRLYGDAWRKWQMVVGRETMADAAAIENLHDFRRDLESKQGLAINTARMHVRAIKTVFAWGEANEVLSRNRLAAFRFKVQKEKRPVPPPQFTPDEFLRMLAQFNPEKATQWRSYVTLVICGFQGARQWSVLHLQWADVDLEAGRLTWQAEWDKVGKTWHQPMRLATRKALEHARLWRARLGYNGPWVVPAPRSPKDEPYDIQTFWWNLKAAAKRAGVAWIRGRAGHGFRRMVAKDVHSLTKDAVLALRSIGDTDIRQAERYVQTAEDELARIFAELDASERNETVTEGIEEPSKSL